MRRLRLVALFALTLVAAAPRNAKAQFHRHHHSGCGFGGFYSAPRGYGFASFGPFGYSSYSFSGLSFGGLNVGVGTVGPFAYSAPIYSAYPLGYSYIPAAPLVIQSHPIFLGQNPFDNRVLREWMPDEDAPAARDNVAAPAPAPPPAGFVDHRQQRELPLLVKPSTLEGRRKAVRAVALGDEALRQQNWAQAYVKYKEAATAAGDQAPPHLRLAIVQTMLGHFGLAADELKRGLRRDPTWPASATPLDELLGASNILAKQGMLERLIAWVREDIRDPDRLFLVGAILFLDQDPDRATQFLQAANKLAGSPAYVQAFLNVQPAGGGNKHEPVVPADGRQLPPTAPAPDSRSVPPPPQPQLAEPPATPRMLPPPAPAPQGTGKASGIPAPPQIGPQFPGESSPAPEQPAVLPVPKRDGPDGFGPAFPVLPAPSRAAAPSKPAPQAAIPELSGPQLRLPDEPIPDTTPLVSRKSSGLRTPPRGSAIIFRGNRRYEYFPRRPVADAPTIIEDSARQ